MENSFYNMEFRKFVELFAEPEQAKLGDDFCIVSVRYGEQKLEEFQSPARLDAYVVFFSFGGSVRISMNMKEFVLEKDQMAIFLPGYIGYIKDFDCSQKEDIHHVYVAVSRRYMSMMNLDLNRIITEGAIFFDKPTVNMSEEERRIIEHYLKLAYEVVHSSLFNRQECIGALVASIFFLAAGIYNRHLSQVRKNAVMRSSRADDIFSRFIHLLAEHHVRERNVSFYAERMGLSPKYFSKLIKMSSGRSAPDWIDSYVILEAKNLLKYSDMSIKEIVFRLNFSDQPTFTKFFKAHTGITPAQFRKKRELA